MQFTIESRELTSEYTHRPSVDTETQHTTVEATDADEAIAQYLRRNDSELVSFTKPAGCNESIATVKKEDVVFLVRVYAA